MILPYFLLFFNMFNFCLIFISFSVNFVFITLLFIANTRGKILENQLRYYNIKNIFKSSQLTGL